MRSDWREPFFIVFVILAVVIGLLAWVRHPGNEATGATYAAGATSSAPVPTSQLLPTPMPTAVPDLTPSEALLTYAPDAIVLSGVVPVQPVADALVAAAAVLVGREAVDDQLQVVEDPELTGTRLTLEGRIADEVERTRIVAAVTGIGVQINDRLVLDSEVRTVADVIAATPELSQFDGFLRASTLVDLLGDPEGSFTVFAPSDGAFTVLDTPTINALSDLELLAEVLRFHVVEGARSAAELEGADVLATLQGGTLTVGVDVEGTLKVGDATVVVRDLDAVNGVVHVIDVVQIPATVATEIELNRLVELDPVQFSPGSATILQASIPILEQAAAILVANPSGAVEIQGHTDTDGDEALNLELSQKRADAVLSFLVDHGVDPGRLTAIGFGETQLKVPDEKTSADKAANRRIEFRVAR